MRIEVVAKNFQKASDFLRNEVGMTGRAVYHKIGTVKVWHGDVIDVNMDRGELRNVYSVTVDDQTTVLDDVQYVA